MASTRREGTSLRRGVLWVSAALAALGIYWIARAFVVDGHVRFGNPVGEVLSELPSTLAAPLQIRAEVTLVKGECGVSAGDKCEFLVEQRARGEGTFYCNAQVTCAGRLLYGGPDRGYFACRFFETPQRGVMGSDPSTTGSDQDAAIHLDTRSGVLRIWDDGRGPHGAFTVEADVLSAQ
ncbi:MAG: hypothetical protein QM778_37285 [Myxococcales bacterium]